MRLRSVLVLLLAGALVGGGLARGAAATSAPEPSIPDGPRKPPASREWVVYSTEIGWLRVGKTAEFDAKWKKRDEIWGGTSEESLKKYLLRKGYATREEALDAVCGVLTRVQLRVEPPLRGQPSRYFTGVLDGKEYFLRLTPGFSREAVEDMSAGRFFKGLEYDFAAERAVLRQFRITPRHVFGRKQWLVHSVSFSTTEGPKTEDRWTCVSTRPERNERGEYYVVLPDGFGGTRTFGLREVEGPFRENYTLARVLKRYRVSQVDLWPPVSSAAGLDVQPRVAAEDVPDNPKDYGDRALPRQAIVPNAALEDWVIYSVEGAWLHVGTRYEYEQPLLKREVIWGGTGDQPAQKKLLAPPPGRKFFSRRQALIALCSALRGAGTEFAPLAQPREVITGEYQGARYRLRIDRGPDGDEVPEFKSLAYDYGDVAATLRQFRIAPLRRFGTMRLVHATGHGTISGPVKDDLWMLAPAGAVGADGKGMTLPDGMGGTFGYSIDYASPPLSDNYAISALQAQLIGGNAALKAKLGFLGVWAEDRGVRAGEAPAGFSPNGSPPEASRVAVVRVLPAEVPRGKSVGITVLASGLTAGATLDFGAGITATGLANGGRDADTPNEIWHATVEVAEDAAPGPRMLQVANPDGGAGSGPAFRVVEPESEGTEFPPLPMGVPAAALEGRLKEELVAQKARYQERLSAAVEAAAGQPSFTGGKPGDTEAFLDAWTASKTRALQAEADARRAAVEFFRTLALAYNRLSEKERGAVEQDLARRAFALRNYRTAQRVLLREKSGLGSAFSQEDLGAYYAALERATWASLELDALVKAWLPVNQARALLHGGYNIYDAVLPDRAAARSSSARWWTPASPRCWPPRASTRR